MTAPGLSFQTLQYKREDHPQGSFPGVLPPYGKSAGNPKYTNQIVGSLPQSRDSHPNTYPTPVPSLQGRAVTVQVPNQNQPQSTPPIFFPLSEKRT